MYERRLRALREHLLYQQNASLLEPLHASVKGKCLENDDATMISER